MRLRLRAPGGQYVLSLPDDATVGHLITQIAEKTSTPSLDIKYGYPPKPLNYSHLELSQPLSALGVALNNETLIISAKETSNVTSDPLTTLEEQSILPSKPSNTFSFTGDAGPPTITSPISLSKKVMDEEPPELPLPDRGATLILRVMPDDNSCLFRAFGSAVLPGDDLTMLELRSLVASAIQADPDTYSKVVLEQDPDEYCKWIQTADAWGGAIEMNILARHFDIEICSIDVKSLRVDRFNEGKATRCILVYSGIHYDTIVQSPSEPPHTKSDSPPEFDKRVWDADDDVVLLQAQELCRQLKAKNYFTDTASMAIKCHACGVVIHGETQAQAHAAQTGHWNMSEVPIST